MTDRKGKRPNYATSHSEVERDARRRLRLHKARTERHDYESGDEYHAMHTDSLCRVCGMPKNDRIHGGA